MCGIVGVIAKSANGLYAVDVTVLEQLLFADQLRGTDGTGIFYDKEWGEASVVKDAVDASTFMWDKQYDRAYKEILKGTFAIGHNRAATKGKLTKENSHPFVEGDITLVHNGTLTYHKNLADTEVDSQAIARSINKVGLDKTLPEIFGAYALVWFDAKDGSLNLIRNDRRPLAIIETPTLYIIASEKDMGTWIARRNKEFVNAAYDIKVGHHYKFDMIDREWVVTKKNITPAVNTHTKVTVGTTGTKTSGKPVTVSTSDIKLGTYITVRPDEVIENKWSTYLRCYYQKGTVQTEVRIWNEKPKFFRDLCKEDFFVVRVSQDVINKNTGERYITGANPQTGFVTRNNKFVTYKYLKDIPKECGLCGGDLPHKKAILEKCDLIYDEVKKCNIFNCLDCTDYSAGLKKVS